MARLLLSIATVCALLLAMRLSAAPPGSDAPATQPAAPRVLVFSKTAGFRHQSIPDGIACIKQLARDGDKVLFEVDATEDAAQFNDEILARYGAVIFLSTTGDILDAEQQAAFERFIKKGRGYVGVHAASDTEYEWPWYASLVGAYFKGHPANQDAVVVVEDHTHPSTKSLPDRWKRYDEWYSFRSNPRQAVHVLASLDETSYKPGELAMGDHPVAWWHLYDGGRAWYTALGHTQESYAEPAFREHLKGGILWALGLAKVVAPSPSPSTPEAPAAAPAAPAVKPSADPSKSNPLSHPAPEG